MFADALNLIIAKKNMKENWKIKRKIIYLKKTIANYRSLQTKERLQKLKKSSKWKIYTKVIYKKIVWFYPLDSLYFSGGWGGWF